MSHVFGYLCSDHSLTHAVMTEFKGQLMPILPEARSGLGIGWLQQNHTLVRKHPARPDSAADLINLLADIPARAMVAHVQHAQSTSLQAADLQPFRYRNWVYAQDGGPTGDPARVQQLLDTLIADMPDHLRRNLQGHTSADVFFHTLLTQLTEKDAFTTILPSASHAKILAKTIHSLQQHAVAAGLEPLVPLLNVVVTERQLVAARVGAPLYYRIFEGIQEAGEKPLFAGHRTRPVDHPQFRAVIVANHITADDHWTEIPDQHVLWVESGWKVKTASIQELAAQ